MNLTQKQLKTIIIEEYIKEEGLEESQAAQDLLRQILGDEEYERRQALKNQGSRGGDTKPMEKPNKASDTMPFGPSDIPSDDAPERHVSGFQDRAGPDDTPSSEVHPIKAAVDGIYELVADMDPEDVAEIFQIVFEKLPGVEMQDAEPEPQTLYSPGAEGRPQVGFKLEELKELIREVLKEGDYHDMGGASEMYDVLDPHGIGGMSDVELVDMARKDGIEKIIVLDVEGDLVNREEVLAALKDV